MEKTDKEIPEFIGDIEIEYYKTYFGDNYDYYSPSLLTNEVKKNFNLYAFFFGATWLLYRRLYKVFLILIVITIIESLIQDWFVKYFGLGKDIVLLTNPIITIINGIIIGKIANYYLIKHVQKKISSITSKYNDKDVIIKKIRKAGSGNWIILVLLFIVIIGVVIMSKNY